MFNGMKVMILSASILLGDGATPDFMYVTLHT